MHSSADAAPVFIVLIGVLFFTKWTWCALCLPFFIRIRSYFTGFTCICINIPERTSTTICCKMVKIKMISMTITGSFFEKKKKKTCSTKLSAYQYRLVFLEVFTKEVLTHCIISSYL